METYDDEPPCKVDVYIDGELYVCPKPSLEPENYFAWELYLELDKRDRPHNGFSSMRIPTRATKELCDIYNVDLETFEDIRILDDVIFPKMMEAARDKKDKKGEK